MYIPRTPIDDFKSERKDITPPLPGILRLVPVCFYAAVLGGLGLSGLFFVQKRSADRQAEIATQELAAAKAKVGEIADKRKELESRILRATDVQAWVEGATPVQPLAVSVARSMRENSSLTDLTFVRDDDSPTSIRMAMKVVTPTLEQIDQTTAAIERERFRVVQPQQSRADGQIDFRATLINETVSRNDEATEGEGS